MSTQVASIKQQSVTPSNSVTSKQSAEINLLTDYNWKNLPGSSVEKNGLLVQFSGHQIVTGSNTRIDSAPINLYGPYLITRGDFRMLIELKNIQKNAVLLLYSQPPQIMDEYRYDFPTLQLTFEESLLKVDSLDSKRKSQISQQIFSIPNLQDYSVSLLRHDESIDVELDNTLIGSISVPTFIEQGKVWFGFTTNHPNGSFVVSQIIAQGTTTGSVEVVDVPRQFIASKHNPNAWQELLNAKKSTKLIGTAISLGPLVSDPEYRKLAVEGWYGVFTTENALKAQFVHPLPNTYSFQETDALVEIAQQNNIQVHGHALVFGEANPAWMNSLPSNEVREMMTDHITTIMSHYKTIYPGVVTSWDVINEPLDGDYFTGKLTLRNHLWHKAMGKGYLQSALQAARNADPEAKLYINEWGLEADGDRWEGFITLIDELIETKVPLDGVGFQTHVDSNEDTINPEVLQSHFRELAKRGLLVRISEMDVSNRALQNQQFGQVLQVCLEEPNCTTFSMWGISSKYGTGTERGSDGNLRYFDGLPFGDNNQPLPVVGTIQGILHRL